MSFTAALGVAVLATLAALSIAAVRGGRVDVRARVAALAGAIVASGLRQLPPEHADRYREECEADLAQLRDSPARMLIHALQTEACMRHLTRALADVPPRRRDPLRRRVLAHLGFPVKLSAPGSSADASYVFSGTMRWRRPDGERPSPAEPDAG